MPDSSGRGPNPYVGPRAFQEADQGAFFGRETEVRQLLSLAVARRVVLLYAPSGAGKTSLLQAGLLPRLRELREVTVLPLARVGGAPAGIGKEGMGNVYTLSVLSYLLGEALGTDADFAERSPSQDPHHPGPLLPTPSTPSPGEEGEQQQGPSYVPLSRGGGWGGRERGRGEGLGRGDL